MYVLGFVGAQIIIPACSLSFRVRIQSCCFDCPLPSRGIDATRSPKKKSYPSVTQR